MSGDFNTALGNSVINAIVIIAWAMERGIYDDPNFKFQVDGDDSWMVYRRDESDPKPSDFQKFGMTTKIEAIGQIPEDVGFCQSKPVMLQDGPMMCRDYRRVLARLPHSIQRYTGVGWERYAKGIAECELALGKGIPILDAIQAGLCAETSVIKRSTLRPRGEDYQYAIAQRVCNPQREITSAARVSYALAWGITPFEQRRLEAKLLRHKWLLDYTKPIITTDRDGA